MARTTTDTPRGLPRRCGALLLLTFMMAAAVVLPSKTTSAALTDGCPAPSYESRYRTSTRNGSVSAAACLDRIDPLAAKRSTGVAYRMVVRVTDERSKDRFCAVVQYRVTSVWKQDRALRHVAKDSTRTADGCTGTTRRHSVFLEPSGVFVHPTTDRKAYGLGEIVRVDTRVCLRTTGGSGAGCSSWRTVLGR